MNSSLLGAKGVLMAQLALLNRGEGFVENIYNEAVPNGPVDFVAVDGNRRAHRYQVKTRSGQRTVADIDVTGYDPGVIDYLVVVLVDMDVIAFIPARMFVNKKWIRLQLENEESPYHHSNFESPW